MGTTTNNGWPTPVATDLVKDGWEAIKDLGDAIDTTLGVYAPSTPGLTLINTTSFSAVASQSVNDVFSSTYDNYVIEGVVLNTVGASTLNFRLRVGGSDASGANYSGANVFFLYANPATFNDNGGSGTGLTTYALGGTDSTRGFVQANISNPNKAQATSFHSRTSGNQPFFNGGSHSLTTQYTGFTIYPGANNITGYISVFGVNK